MCADQRKCWDEVRNFQARNNMCQMRCGDLVFFYHSYIGKEILGIVEVVGEYYPDPTDPKFVCVDLAYHSALPYPVGLKQMKQMSELEGFALLRQPRLSVMPVSPEHWSLINEMSTRNDYRTQLF